MIVTTKSGSRYFIDKASKFWCRVTTAPGSGCLRSDAGNFLAMYGPEVGHPMRIVCPPFIEGGPTRVIYTSRVTEIGSDETCTDQ